MEPICLTSIDVGRAALKMAVTENRFEEQTMRQTLLEQQGIHSVAVDFGGDFVASVKKIIERAVVAAQRQSLVPSNHVRGGGGGRGGASRSRTNFFPGGGTQCRWKNRHCPPRRTSVRCHLSRYWSIEPQ